MSKVHNLGKYPLCVIERQTEKYNAQTLTSWLYCTFPSSRLQPMGKMGWYNNITSLVKTCGYHLRIIFTIWQDLTRDKLVVPLILSHLWWPPITRPRDLLHVGNDDACCPGSCCPPASFASMVAYHGPYYLQTGLAYKCLVSVMVFLITFLLALPSRPAHFVPHLIPSIVFPAPDCWPGRLHLWWFVCLIKIH